MPDDTETPDHNAPDGVDPALWAEFQQLAERIHELTGDRDAGGSTASTTRRIVLEVPEEWYLLFAWIDGRIRRRQRGSDGPTGLTAQTINVSEKVMRKIVSRYISRAIENHFHERLHFLTTGASPLLRPQPPKEKQTVTTTGELDDDIPF